MRSAIAVIMAILGVVLVLSGAAALWASALVKPRAADTPDAPRPGTTGTSSTGSTPAPGGLGLTYGRTGRAVDTVSRIPNAERLIIWGVILLALAAVAAGAIQVSASATAGNQ